MICIFLQSDLVGPDFPSCRLNKATTFKSYPATQPQELIFLIPKTHPWQFILYYQQSPSQDASTSQSTAFAVLLSNVTWDTKTYLSFICHDSIFF